VTTWFGEETRILAFNTPIIWGPDMTFLGKEEKWPWLIVAY